MMRNWKGKMDGANPKFDRNPKSKIEEDLPERRKGDKGKITAARRLRQETTMSLKWIAQRLHMGSWTYVSNLLHEKPRQ